MWRIHWGRRGGGGSLHLSFDVLRPGLISLKDLSLYHRTFISRECSTLFEQPSSFFEPEGPPRGSGFFTSTPAFANGGAQASGPSGAGSELVPCRRYWVRPVAMVTSLRQRTLSLSWKALGSYRVLSPRAFIRYMYPPHTPPFPPSRFRLVMLFIYRMYRGWKFL